MMRGRSCVARGIEVEFLFAFYAEMVLSFSALVRTSNSESPLFARTLIAGFSRCTSERTAQIRNPSSHSSPPLVTTARPATSRPSSFSTVRAPRLWSFCYLGFDMYWKLSDHVAIEGRAESEPLLRRDSEIYLI